MLESIETGLEHAEITKRIKLKRVQSFRDDVMLIGHHGNGREDQNENKEHQETKRATFGIEFCNIVEWGCTDIPKPK